MTPDYSTSEDKRVSGASPSPAPSPAVPVSPRRRWLWFYLPLLVWLAVIVVNSTGIGSSANTDGLLLRCVRLFLSQEPDVDAGALDVASFVVRKLAHVVQYGILAVLVARAVRVVAPSVRRATGWVLLGRILRVVVPVCLLAAVLDESHQGLVASRSGSLGDIGYDALGIIIGSLSVWVFWRRRQKGLKGATEA